MCFNYICDIIYFEEWLFAFLLLMYMFMLIFRCYLQKRVLNISRGPAVRALRAQTDKREYAWEMKNVVERQVHVHNLFPSPLLSSDSSIYFLLYPAFACDL